MEDAVKSVFICVMINKHSIINLLVEEVTGLRVFIQFLIILHNESKQHRIGSEDTILLYEALIHILLDFVFCVRIIHVTEQFINQSLGLFIVKGVNIQLVKTPNAIQSITFP